MTCQCTCGKHILIDLSKSVTIPAAPTGVDLLAVRRDNTGFWQSINFVDFVPNTACAGPTMPTGFGIRIEP